MTDKYNTFEEELNNSFETTSNNKPTYQMDYGDLINFKFNIDYNYRRYKISFRIYTFRYELIYRKDCCCNETGQISITIDSDLSKMILKKGNYYIELVAIINSGRSESELTILRTNECSLYVL